MSYTRTLITVKEAAQMLGLAEKTVHNRHGGTYKLTRIRQGRSVLMIRQEVAKHLESLIKAGQKRRRVETLHYRREYKGLPASRATFREQDDLSNT